MSRLVIPALLLCLGALPATAQATDPTDTSAAAAPSAAEAPPPEQIHVVAQRPGPGMWKVSKGDHVLWVFGTHAPLPKDIEWRSRQVEDAIARSSEYLAPPGAKASPGFFRTIALLPHLIGMRKNPDGASLKDLLPPEQYARWTALRAKYLPDNDDAEHERPIFAAQALVRGAQRQAGLTGGQDVARRIAALVDRHKLRRTSTTVDLPMDNARTLVKDFKKTALKDVACLTKTMDTLEDEIADAGRRAQAWARGSVSELRALAAAEREQACFDSIMDSAAFDAEPAFRNMRALMRQKWIAAAEQALANNASTFAVLQIGEILQRDGVLAALAAKGYAVEQPE